MFSTQLIKRASNIVSRLFCTLIFITISSLSIAAIELPHLITEGMVVQRGEPIPVWGWAKANTEITLTFAGQKQTARANNKGVWQTSFTALPAGGPYTLEVVGDNSVKVINNILVGDVWVCSGQSNMEWVLRNTIGADAVIAATNNANIREFKIPRTWSVAPSKKLAGGTWSLANSENVGEFSAIAYYFADKIFQETGVPIGLVNSSWGGSNIESWMSAEALGKTKQAGIHDMEMLVAEGERQAAGIKARLNQWPGVLVDVVMKADADWSAEALDETDWSSIKAPSHWESQGLEGVDGVIWYRKSIQLTRAQALAGAVFRLGAIDDSDVTWVNGHKIGETNAYDIARAYSVPAKFLKEGRNQIAIRIEDTGGGGGIYLQGEGSAVVAEFFNGETLSLAGTWKMKPDKATVSMLGGLNHTETALYNKMLHPLFKIPVKGILWYQGESNANTLEQSVNYNAQFKRLITDWRSSWDAPELPFYWVQLANFNSGTNTNLGSPWAVVRESQTAALALNNTGHAITIDVGNPDNIHPRDKKTVGDRLARVALHHDYGKTDVHYRGPILKSFSIKKSQVNLTFNTSASALVLSGGAHVKGFEIAGKNGVYHTAKGRVIGGNKVRLTSSVKRPVFVRYAWNDNPEKSNLIDKQNLPAEPFRYKMR